MHKSRRSTSQRPVVKCIPAGIACQINGSSTSALHIHQSTRQYYQSLCIRAPGNTIRACASEHQAVLSEPVHQSTRQYYQSLCKRATGSTIRACASEHQVVHQSLCIRAPGSTKRACASEHQAVPSEPVHESTRQYHQGLCIRADGAPAKGQS